MAQYSIFPLVFQKIKPDSELFEVREKPGPEMPNMAPSITNNADLSDAREINFEYLKHVVLKFMSCRESEVKGVRVAFWVEFHPRAWLTCPSPAWPPTKATSSPAFQFGDQCGHQVISPAGIDLLIEQQAGVGGP